MEVDGLCNLCRVQVLPNAVSGDTDPIQMQNYFKVAIKNKMVASTIKKILFLELLRLMHLLLI